MMTSSAYAWAGEVVWTGLRTLQKRDGIIARWLREDIAPTHDAMAFAAIRIRDAKRLMSRE